MTTNRRMTRDDETGFGPLPGTTDDGAGREPNFAACPKGGQCVMVQRPGSGGPKCSKCGRTL
jgi:hypothetical protein